MDGSKVDPVMDRLWLDDWNEFDPNLRRYFVRPDCEQSRFY